VYLYKRGSFLKAFQAQCGSRPRQSIGGLNVAAVACLVLLAVLAVVQVAHVHPQESAADHCPLCIVMHSAAPVVLAAILIVLVDIGTPAPVIAVRAAIPSYWHPSLFIRPPPLG
jgi:hypothetical protein